MNRSIPYIIIAILLAVIWLQNSCEPNPPSTKAIVIPEKSGTFEPVVPKQEVAKWNDPKPIIKWKEIKIEIENPINLKLFNDYLTAKDSMERMNIMLLAVTERTIDEPFEDSLIKINITGSVYGTVKNIKPTYTIKSIEVDAPEEKETVFRLMGGVEFGNTLQFDSFLVKGNLGFQNKKGNVFTASFDTQQRIWVGYNASIFRIRN
ncbi:hypothetical protein [Flavobacterium sp.]|uniref:hypothetical protein n=1 Tax=Flavobacterium sp. TaxID=239 RepID=UPI0025BA05C0|nr:hypothetical protein [Flavobacterium sp.]MBA4154143.1 hypothetical protein [Flavobacterium sp.]